jgi:hypothetical protein
VVIPDNTLQALNALAQQQGGGGIDFRALNG